MVKIFIGSKLISNKNPYNKLIKCCNCHKYYDFKGNIFSSIKVNILICPHCGSKHEIIFKPFDKEIYDLNKINKLDLALIDIGSPAIDRSGNHGPTYTIVLKENPADGTGTITSIEIWAYGNLSGVTVATFFLVSGNILTARDSHSIGSVTAGSKQTFEVSLDVEFGDYLGMYWTGGFMDFNYSGYVGFWRVLGDQTNCSDYEFTFVSGDTLSLYGTGETPPPPPIYKDSARTGIYSFKTS